MATVIPLEILFCKNNYYILSSFIAQWLRESDNSIAYNGYSNAIGDPFL